jgi:dTDP-4-amino-4,6-dideoxygalactose transaminase
MTTVPFIDLRAQFESLRENLEAECLASLARCDYILGEDVQAFEREFATFCDATHCVGVDSGLSALELALRAYGIGTGDEVITVCNSFIATALAISATGATPVLVDVDESNFCIDPARVVAAITARTRAIIPVHLFGQPCDMDAVLNIAREHGLRVIEDAAQAHGACFAGRRVGALGHAAAFSFYPAKNLGAAGDGGALVTSDAQLAERVRVLANYGQHVKNEHEVMGGNNRLDTFQATVLRVKLRSLEAWNRERRRHSELYAALLADMDVGLPATRTDVEHVWHVYVVRVANRDRVRRELQLRGVATGIHYPTPIHLQLAYRHLGYKAGDFPVAERLAPQLLSLPIYPELSVEQIAYVADTLGALTRGRLRVAP